MQIHVCVGVRRREQIVEILSLLKYKKESIFHLTFNIFCFYGGINQGELSNDINKCISQLDEVQIEFALVTDFEKKCLLKLTSTVL